MKHILYKIPISDRRDISTAVLSMTPLLPSVYESLEIQKFRQKFICSYTHNYILASCPSGSATAHGLDVLTELYVIYMERYNICAQKLNRKPTIFHFRSPLHTGILKAVDVRKFPRKYIWINYRFHNTCFCRRSIM